MGVRSYGEASPTSYGEVLWEVLWESYGAHVLMLMGIVLWGFLCGGLMGALWGGLMGRILSIRLMLGKVPYAVLWEVLCGLLWRRLMEAPYGMSYGGQFHEESYGELVLGSAPPETRRPYAKVLWKVLCGALWECYGRAPRPPSPP